MGNSISIKLPKRHVVLGDFKYAGQRIRFHASEDFREFYVIKSRNKAKKEAQVFLTFAVFKNAKDMFEREVRTSIDTMLEGSLEHHMKYNANTVAAVKGGT